MAFSQGRARLLHLFCRKFLPGPSPCAVTGTGPPQLKNSVPAAEIGHGDWDEHRWLEGCWPFLGTRLQLGSRGWLRASH